jgi:TolB-like protein/DNA-binding winged helix-turn-helix (wHTH) protein/Flp pilus assembly protein TadD
MSATPGTEVFAFAGYCLDPRRRRLSGPDGRSVPLSGRAFDALLYLVRHPNQLIDRDRLMKAVWPDLVVEENNLSQTIAVVRRALNETAGENRFVITVPGRGFQFAPAVMLVPGALGDDTRAPRYIEEVGGRGASIVAQVRPLAESRSISESLAPPWLKSRRGMLGWIGGSLIVLALFLLPWAITHYRGASTAPVSIHTLAVLPLENLSGDKEQEYFADGMTDALTTDLAQIGALHVISRTSAMQFKGSNKTLPQIGRDLRVDAVVEGTVVRSDGRVRITAQLVEAGSDRHLWAKSYERDLKEVLVLQDEIAQDIAEQIRVTLAPKERSLLKQNHTVDPEAHDAYLRGRYWWHKSTVEDERKGLDYFQKAIAKDPNYALAYSGIADSFVWLAHHGGIPQNEAFPKAKEAAIKALELDPSLAEAHTSLAIVKFTYDADWSGAEEEFKQAIALNSNWATAHHWYSHYLAAMGRPDEAVEEIERARNLDPYSLPISTWLGVTLYFARRYDDALRQTQQVLEMYPEHAAVFYDEMAGVYEQKGAFAEAFGVRQQALNLNKNPTAGALAAAYQRSGYRGYVLKKIEILEQSPRLDGFVAADLAHWYRLLKDEEHAVTYFEHSYEQGNPWLLYLQVDPANDFMRSSARFRALVRRVGLPQ